MDESGALGVVQIVLGALGLSGAGGGVASLWMHHQNRKAKVSADERQAKTDRMSALEAENLALIAEKRELLKGIRQRDDFIHRMRGLVPPPPPPWPEDFTHF